MPARSATLSSGSPGSAAIVTSSGKNRILTLMAKSKKCLNEVKFLEDQPLVYKTRTNGYVAPKGLGTRAHFTGLGLRLFFET